MDFINLFDEILKVVHLTGLRGLIASLTGLKTPDRALSFLSGIGVASSLTSREQTMQLDLSNRGVCNELYSV